MVDGLAIRPVESLHLPVACTNMAAMASCHSMLAAHDFDREIQDRSRFGGSGEISFEKFATILDCAALHG
jgi:hypothetical protein